jgi:hypothetical protein
MTDDPSSDGTSSDSTSSDGTSSDSTSSDATSSDSTSSDGTSSDSTSSDGTSSDSTSSDATSSDSSASAIVGGWSDAVAGGWNSGARTVGSVQRIPLQGLTQINQDPAKDPATSESAAGRAILCVPASLDVSQPIEVLFHLHGHNIGYRQRVASNLSNAGSVRDVLMDQIEDQLGSCGRPMIAVLPQGTLSSGFSSAAAPFDCNACLTEVLNAAVSAGVWSSAPTVSRVALSAHSGGGGSIAIMETESGKPRLPTAICALFLFEAINGPNELAAETAYVTAKLNADLQNLTGLSAQDQLNYLKTSFRFRGIYNTQDDFYATFYATINQAIAAWFAKNAAALGGAGSDAYNALIANYQVVRPSPYVAHDGIVGQGNLGQALAMLQ